MYGSSEKKLLFKNSCYAFALTTTYCYKLGGLTNTVPLAIALQRLLVNWNSICYFTMPTSNNPRLLKLPSPGRILC